MLGHKVVLLIVFTLMETMWSSLHQAAAQPSGGFICFVPIHGDNAVPIDRPQLVTFFFIHFFFFLFFLHHAAAVLCSRQ